VQKGKVKRGGASASEGGWGMRASQCGSQRSKDGEGMRGRMDGGYGPSADPRAAVDGGGGETAACAAGVGGRPREACCWGIGGGEGAA
jgi:hypothetical protein